MRTKNTFLTPLLMCGIAFLLGGRVAAQSLTTLYSFTGGTDGAQPVGNLILSANTLYGTTESGGSSGFGTVFAVNTDGTGFTNLHSFRGSSGGGKPESGLILSANTLYGTAELGGNFGHGTVFAINTNGTGFINLHHFTGSDGANPFAGLMMSGGSLYGTTQNGGNVGMGTVFAVHSDGTGFTNLHVFNSVDGATPLSGVILSGGSLYGTAWYGGRSGNGTVFAVGTNGSGFTNLHTFSPRIAIAGTNGDGSNPQAGLALSGNTLYGTTELGGGSGHGTVFVINADGTSFATVHSFTGDDGAAPDTATLVLSGNTFYGTTDSGGGSGFGTVFAVNTDGTGFTTLHSFTGGSDGATPLAGLTLANHTLYGTTVQHGSGNAGTVFRISFTPQLIITAAAANLVLTWPANVAGFDYTGYTLQTTTNLDSSAVWITNSAIPVVVNGQNTVTEPIGRTQRFYRLTE